MTAEGHEMESVSSIGKDDDPDFVPPRIERRSRTGSLLQKAKSAYSNRTLPPIQDPRAVEDGTSNQCLTILSLFDTYAPPKLSFYRNVRTGSSSKSRGCVM
jgi:hypothetical protein